MTAGAYNNQLSQVESAESEVQVHPPTHKFMISLGHMRLSLKNKLIIFSFERESSKVALWIFMRKHTIPVDPFRILAAAYDQVYR